MLLTNCPRTRAFAKLDGPSLNAPKTLRTTSASTYQSFHCSFAISVRQFELYFNELHASETRGTHLLKQKVNGFIIEQIFVVSGFSFVDHVPIIAE